MEEGAAGAASGSAAKKGRDTRRIKSDIIPRDRILHAAAGLFRERGYQRTTVRDIADQVGILSGSLFYHFRTKEEMLLEIMREAAMSICLRAEELIDTAASSSEQLRELIRLEIRSFTSEHQRNYHGVLFFEWREVPETAQAEFTRLRKRYQRTWLGVLDRCQADGTLRCEPDAASLILHGFLSNAMTWYSPAGRYSTEEFGDILMRLMLNGPHQSPE